jgi:hypothetical protein
VVAAALHGAHKLARHGGDDGAPAKQRRGEHLHHVHAWWVVRGAWCVVRGAWCVVRGAWCVVRDAWCVVRGAWCMRGTRVVFGALLARYTHMHMHTCHMCMHMHIHMHMYVHV